MKKYIWEYRKDTLAFFYFVGFFFCVGLRFFFSSITGLIWLFSSSLSVRVCVCVILKWMNVWQMRRMLCLTAGRALKVRIFHNNGPLRAARLADAVTLCAPLQLLSFWLHFKSIKLFKQGSSLLFPHSSWVQKFASPHHDTVSVGREKKKAHVQLIQFTYK